MARPRTVTRCERVTQWLHRSTHDNDKVHAMWLYVAARASKAGGSTAARMMVT